MYTKEYNILDYLVFYGEFGFEQVAFNAVDGLIFSQLAYCNIDGLVDSGFENKITLNELARKFMLSENVEERSQMGALINEWTVDLLVTAGKTKRFGNVFVSNFVNIVDERKKEQFSALTFEIEKKKYVISFRGTDDSIVGWYEDFNLGYMEQIPSHVDGAEYLKKALSELKGEFILTGHSKGGNIVVKAGTSVDKKNQNRILEIYNYDGPGFYSSFYKSEEFLQIENKLKCFYPESCFVGMMFEHYWKYSIVKSSEDALMQHDPFSWKVLGSGFEYVSDFDEKSQVFYKSFNDWANRLSNDEKKSFIDLFFDIMYASGAKTNYEIEKNKIVCGGKMLSRLSEFEDDERDKFMNAIKVLLSVAKNNIPMFSVFDIKENVKEQFKKLRR